MPYHLIETDMPSRETYSIGAFDSLEDAEQAREIIEREPTHGVVFIIPESDWPRAQRTIVGARSYDAIPHLQEGGIIAEVHPGEAVIPLDTPEGQEAINEAVEVAAGEAIETAVEVVEEAHEIAEDAAAQVINDELRTAMREEMTTFINDLHALSLIVTAEPEPEPEPAQEVTQVVEVEAPDVRPERKHWFFG